MTLAAETRAMATISAEQLTASRRSATARPPESPWKATRNSSTAAGMNPAAARVSR